jgi:hypothetical protein
MMMVRLRQLWIEHPDATSRALLGEIARLHDVLRSVDQLSATVAAVWLAERGGRLAALHRLNLLLEQEPAVMEQKVRRGGRGVATQARDGYVDEDDKEYPPTQLDPPYDQI